MKRKPVATMSRMELMQECARWRERGPALEAVARAAGRAGRPLADDEGPACVCGVCRAYARLARLNRKLCGRSGSAGDR